MSIRSIFNYKLKPDKLEKAYREETLAEDKLFTKSIIIFVMFAVSGFVILDFFFVQTISLYVTLAIRSLLIIISLTAVSLISRLIIFKHFDRIIFLWCMIMVSHLLIVGGLRPGDYVTIVAYDIFVIFGIYLAVPIPLRFQIIPTLFLTIGSVVLWNTYKPPPWETIETVATISAYLATNIFGILFSIRINQLRRMRFVQLNKEKTSKKALQESEGRLQLCLRAGRLAWYDLNIQTGEATVSPEYPLLIGYDPEGFDASLQTWLDNIHSDDRHAVLNAYQDCLVTGASVTMEYRRRMKDGNWCWLSSTGQVTAYDSDRKPLRMVGIHADITKRKQAEEELRENQTIFNSFLEHSPVYIFFKDSESRSLMLSRNYEKMLGMPLENILGKTMDELFPSDLSKSMIEDDKQILREGKALTIVEELGGRTYETTKFPIVLDGNAKMLAGFTLDITERKRNEEEKEALQSKLQQATKMQAVGTLAGGIAHEFNNLLAVILGCTDLAILEIPQSGEAKDLLESVKKASIRASSLVKQILAFSRQSQQKKLPLNLGTLIKESLKMTRASIPASVEIETNIHTQGVTSTVDPTEIQQITMNLCSNAVWAMKEQGTINISLHGIELKAKKAKRLGVSKGKYAELTFSDTGQGIDAEIKTRIFDPFFTQKEVGQGTGMGLSIVYSIMESYGGVITVESETGKGTTFQLYFPVTTKPAIEKPEDLEDLPKGTERILLVDDEEMVAKMEYKIIRSLGYDVDLHMDSQKALDAFKKSPESYHLIITDQVMPEISGDGLAKEIRSIRPEMPIILSTGHSSQVNDEKAKSIGINAFVYKPLLIKDFAKLIRKVLDAK